MQFFLLLDKSFCRVSGLSDSLTDRRQPFQDALILLLRLGFQFAFGINVPEKINQSMNLHVLF